MKRKITGILAAIVASMSLYSAASAFTLDEKGVPEAGRERSVILVISDLHLGVDDAYSENVANRPHLAHFLAAVRESTDVKELVLAGDMIDEWFIPAGKDTYEGASQKEFVRRIAENNKEVFDAFSAIIGDGKIKVTYVPGNHDLLISPENMEAVLPGISQARDVRGLGTYSPEEHPEIAIEHGHRYNFFCAPDPISNSEAAPGSILPPGYFFTRVATLSVVQGHPTPGYSPPEVAPNSLGEDQELVYLYWKDWKWLSGLMKIKEGFDDKIITTNIDGFTERYSLADLFPYQSEPGGVIDMKLYRGIEKTWDERQRLNGVGVNIPARRVIEGAALASELDSQAEYQYFQNPESNRRIVVFGHSHEPRLIPSKTLAGQDAVYVNTGTWIDRNSMPTMTFAAIFPKKDGQFVGLYQYAPDGTIEKLDSAELQ